MKLVFAFGLIGSAAQAATVCDDAARHAAELSGVPLPILTAITRVETNTRRNGTPGPWPWTLNHAGKGEWFDSPEDALDRMAVLAGTGASFDVGCFQINTRWHGAAFGSAEEMIEPETNARYAATYLLELFAETGDWKAAVAAYHSRDPDRGAGYAEKVAAVMRRSDTPVAPADAAAGTAAAVQPRANHFPLLLAGDPISEGSLFGVSGQRAPLVGP